MNPARCVHIVIAIMLTVMNYGDILGNVIRHGDQLIPFQNWPQLMGHWFRCDVCHLRFPNQRALRDHPHPS